MYVFPKICALFIYLRLRWVFVGALSKGFVVVLGLPVAGSDGKAVAYNEGDPGLISGSGRSSGEGNGNPLGWAGWQPTQCHCPLSALAWKIPWMKERGRLQSTGSGRVGHD